MAWTATKNLETVFGNVRAQFYLLTADSATLELDTGLGHVIHIEQSYKSAASASEPNVAINVTSAAVASPGTVSITGVTSGDDLWLTVYGR
jgi:hypothetical protein